MRLIWSDYIVGVIFIILCMPFILYFIPDSIQDSRFTGTSDSFYIEKFLGQSNITDQLSQIHFQANVIILNMNNSDLNFWGTKNITIEYYKGERKVINYSRYIIIKNYKNQFLVISNGYIGLFFTNFTMSKTFDSFSNRIDINGTIKNEIYSERGEVSIDNNSIDDISIGDEKVTNFKRIIFEMDRESWLDFSPETSEVSAYPISDLKINSKFSKLILNKGEGTIRLGNHHFDIKPADDLSIEILPYTSKLYVTDTNIDFRGITSHSFLNNENIIISDFQYWLKFKPETISGFGVLIATSLAVLSLYFSFRSQIIKNKDEKQRILNVLFAEFKTNKTFLEDLKNSIGDMIENSGEIQVKFTNFIFLGFRDDGFNAFRNLGGFQYIDRELYDKIANYYIISYKIHKKIDKIIHDKKLYKLMGQDINDLMQEIESIESLNEQLRNELMNEIQKT